MAAQTAIAPAGMRQMVPGASSASGASMKARSYPAPSYRPLKPLSATHQLRPVALAPICPSPRGDSAPGILSISPSPNRTTASGEAMTKPTKAGTRRTERADSEASTSSSNNALSRSVSASTSPFDEDSVIQPRKEWFLPARAKPGRKPSEVEPPTKRKAQNRASQRAFRERKQSYVASLEERIEEHERREAGLSSELQKIARKLKEENDALRRENVELKERVQRLEGSPENSKKIKAESTVVLHPIDPSALRPSSPFMPLMDRDCGFCTEQGPCVCRGDGILDLADGREPPSPPEADDFGKPRTTMEAQPQASHSRSKLWYTVPGSMGPPPPPQVCPTESRTRLGFGDNGTSTSILPSLQISSRSRPKLWPVYAPNLVNAAQQPSAAVPVYRLRKVPNSGIDAACSGDPANCSACSTDPALAAFCQAVTSHLSASSSASKGPSAVTPAILDAGNALPLRLKRKRSFDGPISHRSILNPAAPKDSSDGGKYSKCVTRNSRWATEGQLDSYVTRQTIPEAWQRIKQHPSFPQWRGGLDLLADVVSKRAESMSEVPPRVDIEKSMSISMKFPRKSNDRDTTGNEIMEAESEAKRRRLYVSEESVEDALALLDRGSQPKSCDCPLNRSL